MGLDQEYNNYNTNFNFSKGILTGDIYKYAGCIDWDSNVSITQATILGNIQLACFGGSIIIDDTIFSEQSYISYYGGSLTFKNSSISYVDHEEGNLTVIDSYIEELDGAWYESVYLEGVVSIDKFCYKANQYNSYYFNGLEEGSSIVLNSISDLPMPYLSEYLVAPKGYKLVETGEFDADGITPLVTLVSTIEINYVLDGGNFVNTCNIIYDDLEGEVVDLPLVGCVIKEGHQFKGWTLTNEESDEEYVSSITISEGITVYARWQINEYIVNFYLEDKETLHASVKVAYGEDVLLNFNNPTKESNAQYHYYFDKWLDGEEEAEFTNIREHKNVYASFRAELRKYNIRWMLDNEVLEDKEVEYGTLPVYEGEVPVKKSAILIYEFKGWDKEIVEVTGEADYKAEFNVFAMVNFYLEDKETLHASVKVAYGEDVLLNFNNPTKESNAQYHYYFDKWLDGEEEAEFTNIREHKNVYASFNEGLRKYSVKWIVEGEVIELDEDIEYGIIPVYSSLVPIKESETLIYEFKGWDKHVSEVTGVESYIAVFEVVGKVVMEEVIDETLPVEEIIEEPVERVKKELKENEVIMCEEITVISSIPKNLVIELPPRINVDYIVMGKSNNTFEKHDFVKNVEKHRYYSNDLMNENIESLWKKLRRNNGVNRK